MNYHITTKDGDIIASFLHKSDRDYSLDALKEIYPAYDLITTKDDK